MPLAYKDFFPAVVKRGFFTVAETGSCSVVLRANEWLMRSGVTIVNVETVVLPNVEDLEGASEAGIRTSGEMSSYWYQIVRVWYESESPQS